LLAVPHAARLLGISRAAAYRMVASGELPAGWVAAFTS
jgi:excisionase family DNA binding protein